jgi:hypothetical protein
MDCRARVSGSVRWRIFGVRVRPSEVVHAACFRFDIPKGVLVLSRRMNDPIKPKPSTIIAQLAGAGMAAIKS